MSETAPPPAVAVASDGNWVQRHHFLLRRLHSLTGVVPIGAFLLEHLYTNFNITLGAQQFQTDVNWLWNLPGLLYLEIFLIWLPLGFHAALGFAYVFTGSPNSPTYRYQANWRYTLMRITGIIALLYIFFHIAVLRWHWSFGFWHTPFDPDHATRSTALAVQYAWPWVMVFYVVGLLSTVFHFANGLWTFAITWGLTLSVPAQRRWGYVCLVIGLILAIAGLVSIGIFSSIDTHAMMQHAGAV